MTMHTIHSVNVKKVQHPQKLSSLRSPQKEDTLLATAISRILQIGVLCSAMMIIAGLLILLLQIGAAVPLHLQTFPHTPGQVWSGLLLLQPQAIIATGLLF